MSPRSSIDPLRSSIDVEKLSIEACGDAATTRPDAAAHVATPCGKPMVSSVSTSSSIDVVRLSSDISGETVTITATMDQSSVTIEPDLTRGMTPDEMETVGVTLPL